MIPRAPRPFPVCFQLLYFICSVAATGHKGKLQNAATSKYADNTARGKSRFEISVICTGARNDKWSQIAVGGRQRRDADYCSPRIKPCNAASPDARFSLNAISHHLYMRMFEIRTRANQCIAV